jgi:hypothetical protein
MQWFQIATEKRLIGMKWMVKSTGRAHSKIAIKRMTLFYLRLRVIVKERMKTKMKTANQ